MTGGCDDRPEIRPEVIQAVYSALMDLDPSRLGSIAGLGVTPAERNQAEKLYLASMLAGMDQQERAVDAIVTLYGETRITGDTSWPELFDNLTPDRAVKLRGLYDALPDGARAEYDKRYGHPENLPQ
jgi:hypothetical protein